ncbi:MAG: hypothetical protein RSB02_01730 [Anaerovoracaceae bacterium]
MEKDKGRLMTFPNNQISISSMEMVDFNSIHRTYEMNYSISAKEIEILYKNPWILLQACNMHFYDFLYCEKDNKNDVVGTMFFLEREIEEIRETIKKVFRTSLFLKTNVESNNQLVYKVDVNGITELGETALQQLNLKGAIPNTWKELYLTDTSPMIEKEGIYVFDKPSILQKNNCDNSLNKLLKNPFFCSMNISNIPLMYCEESRVVQEILRICKEAIIIVEKHNSQYLKTVCWEL